MPSRTARVLLSVAFAALVAPQALLAQQVLYKWTDANGKIQYSDRPPKDFKGPVTRIEPEYEKATLPAAPKSATPPADAAKGAREPATDIAAKRRATRARLEAQLSKARDKLDAAKTALADASSPEPEERQVVQQRKSGGGMHGMAPRSNCRVEVGRDGRKATMCPTAVAGAGYYERIAGLEEAVRVAEEELAAAELAWRRGVD